MTTCIRCMGIVDDGVAIVQPPCDERIRVIAHRNGSLSVYGGSGQSHRLCTACGDELEGLITAFCRLPGQVVISISDRRLLSKLHVVMRALNALPSDYTHLDLVWLGAGVMAYLRRGERLDCYTIDLQTGVLSPVAARGKEPQ